MQQRLRLLDHRRAPDKAHSIISRMPSSTAQTFDGEGVSGSLVTRARTSAKLNAIHKTDCFIYFRELTAANKELTGKRRMVMAASWHGWCKTETGSSRLESTRDFSPLFMANFENGVATISQGAFLHLRLITQDRAKWVNQNDVNIFLYEVVGLFNAPRPDDIFSRLDDHAPGLTTSERMASEEALVGLQLLHSGTVPVSTLIENRSKPRPGFQEGPLMTQCKMKPFLEHQNQHHARLVMPVREVHQPLIDPIELKLTSEANRVISPDSR